MGRSLLPCALVALATLGAGMLVAAAPAGSEGGPAIRVKTDDPTAPAPCRAARVGEVIGGLFEAAGRRHAGDVRKSLAGEPVFQWYSVTTVRGDRRLRHVVRRRPRSAAQLLVDRSRRAGERIRVVAVELSYEARRNIANFGQLMRYRARDAAGGRWRRGHGKGAIDCASGRVMVWSAVAEVGPRAKGGRHRFCGEKADDLLRRRDLTVCRG